MLKTMRPCQMCGRMFQFRKDYSIPGVQHRGPYLKYCSNACRQRAYRKRKSEMS